MFDELRLRWLGGGYMAVAQVQLGELTLHVLKLNLGVTVQRHRDALVGQDRLKELRIQPQPLPNRGEGLPEAVRMDALCQARGLLNALASPPCVLTVRFLARSSARILPVAKEEFRLIGSRSEMLLQQVCQCWVQRDRDRLAAFDDGLDLHSIEIEAAPPQPVKLRPSARVE